MAQPPLDPVGPIDLTETDPPPVVAAVQRALAA